MGRRNKRQAKIEAKKRRQEGSAETEDKIKHMKNKNEVKPLGGQFESKTIHTDMDVVSNVIDYV